MKFAPEIPLYFKLLAMTENWVKSSCYDYPSRSWATKIINHIPAVKAARWDDINFLFKFCNEVVCPTVHDFVYFRFKKIFFIHIFMNQADTQTIFLYT